MTFGHHLKLAVCIGLAASVLPSCSGRDRAPPQVPGVELGRLTSGEMAIYRRVLQEEVSPCGGAQSLEQSLRAGDCALSPFAARFVAARVEVDDTREEIAERYLERYRAGGALQVPVENAPVLGDPAAPVKLVVFSDFECPHCARAASDLRAAVERHPGTVAVFFRNFPLPRHRVASHAALAGLAAQGQGRFWELHDALFANRTRLDEALVLQLAEETGLDVEQFQQDLLDPALEARVRADQDLGEQLGVEGTPTIFINGRRMDDSGGGLEVWIDEELARLGLNPDPSPASNAPAEGAVDGGQ